jgi:NTE family protein
LRFELFIDSQNKYPYPDEGFLINGFYETAQKNLGGDVGFTKLFLDYKAIFSFNSIHTLTPRFKIGFADETLPLSQQFSLGGHDSFFGYRDYEQRGRQVFTSSIEYRAKMPFKLYFDTYLKFRYDLGNIWEQREEIKFKDLRHGIGATLSLDTPIGPADFSVGKSFIVKESFPNNIVSWGPTTFYFTIGYYY